MRKFCWTDLNPSCIVSFTNLITACASKGCEVVPYFGLRTLEEQACLWRQSRSTSVIQLQIQKLRDANCNFLADVIVNVGPQKTAPWATNAIPGLSWHNWGLAVDFYVKHKNIGPADWNAASYEILGQEAKKMGLRWGGDFSKPDPGHVQINPKELPEVYDLKYINDYFYDKAKVASAV